MPRTLIARSLPLLLLLMLGLSRPASAQNIPFTSGPIPMCDTSTFTANVSGYGYLSSWGEPWSSWIESLTINITSDHPQTLQISLTSPAGTTLLLSAFNGAGGQNYTNTVFTSWGSPITSGSAPFTGVWTPQGGGFNVFDGQLADGTWTITVVDTACANGGTGPGGTWTPGWFDGSSGNGGFAFGFNAGPPPCIGWIPSDVVTICAGESVDIQGYYMAAAPGYNYYFGLPWMSGPVPDPTAVSEPGIYYVEAIDPWDGCWYQASFEIISAQVSLGPDQVIGQCSDEGPVDLTALFTPGSATSLWSLDGTPISVAAAAAATVPGVYELIGDVGTAACNDTAEVTLTINPGVLVGPDQAVSLCAGSSLDLTTLYVAGAGVAEWTEMGVPVADPTAITNAGTYTLTVTNPAGCTGTADVTVTVQPQASLGADQSHDLCSNAVLDLTTLYTTTGFTAAWTSMGLPVADPSAVSAGTYRLVVSNGSGCTDTAFVSVNALAAPVLGPDVTANACAGEVVDLTSYFTTAGLTAAWTVSGSPVTDPAAVSATGLYTLIATDVAGCSDEANVMLTVAPNLLLGPDQSLSECAGTVVDLTALYATGANTTAWTESGSPVADPAAIMSTGVYTLTATNAAGCSATATVTVQFDPAPALGPDHSLSICSGSAVDLTALVTNTGLAETWTLDGATVPVPSAVDESGVYQAVVINGAGCSDTAVVVLAVTPLPSLGADQSFPLCPWQTVDLTAAFPVDGLTASYTLNGQPVPDPTVVSGPGLYTVTVMNATGCTDEAVATVIAMDCLCVAEFVHEGDCLQDPVQFTLLADSAIVSAQWDFGTAAAGSREIDPRVSFSGEDVVVTLHATLSCGAVEVQRTIRVRDCSDSCSVWIPSAFTPDNDDINDTWTWYGECEPEDFSMEIYDRFGEMVFASKDPETKWDGTYRGKTSPQGVYVYRVGYRLPYQDHKEVMGSMALVR